MAKRLLNRLQLNVTPANEAMKLFPSSYNDDTILQGVLFLHNDVIKKSCCKNTVFNEISQLIAIFTTDTLKRAKWRK